MSKREKNSIDTKNSADTTLGHFREHGWMRVANVFTSEQATEMRNAIWRSLAGNGIRRDQPSTWTVKRPTNLQHLKGDPAFNAVGGESLIAAIDAIFEGRRYEYPQNWGAFFLAFPSHDKWRIPTSGWHIDAKYTSALWPIGGIKTHALLGDVHPRGGGTLILSGSHHLVHGWFTANPPPQDARGADMRQLLQLHPYVGDLHREGDDDARIARFMERAEDVDGVSLRVVENIGAAGDVVLLHPLVLHVAAPNSGSAPRFLLSGGVTTDQWGWQSGQPVG